jgi:nucleotide-binding universal stress UspA family protein
VVVAVDGSPSSEHAFDLAVEVAAALGARCTVLTVAPPRTYFPPGKGESTVSEHEVRSYTRLGRRWAERAREKGIAQVETASLEGLVADRIVGYAQEHHPDLLVLGARSLSGARRMFLGGVSTSVVAHLPCPVLVVPEPPSGSAPAGEEPPTAVP